MNTAQAILLIPHLSISIELYQIIVLNTQIILYEYSTAISDLITRDNVTTKKHLSVTT